MVKVFSLSDILKYNYDHIFLTFSHSGINHRAHAPFIRRCSNINVHNTRDYTATLYR